MGRENRYKYEWVNGVAMKTDYTMNPNQLHIQYRLQDFFMRLLATGKVTGQLLGEPDLILFEEHHRRPDMAWLTLAQVERLQEDGAIEVPAFVIEVISNNDAATKLADKMEDYRKAGVKVVWQVYPNIQQIHVYGGKNLSQAVVCMGEDICSAAPALPAFELPVLDVFKTSR